MIHPEAMDTLIAALAVRGFRVVGPTVQAGAIVNGDLASAADLPIGWTEVQEGGAYRLLPREDRAFFGHALGPHSWRQFLWPARVRLWQARRLEQGFEITEEAPKSATLAIVGARSCDLGAIGVLDRVLLNGDYAAGDYAARRSGMFVVAVNCSDPGGTCFCASMGTGPKLIGNCDLVLTEILGEEHRFVVEARSERGAEILGELPRRPVTPTDARAAERVVNAAASRMGRAIDVAGIRDLLARNLEHSRWNDVASRCLACGNCTLVCPTCFCVTIEDATDLAGETAERLRAQDSCFSVEHSFIHGGCVRSSVHSRYRQWLTHKFGTWHDQFGTSGCVGCGRCITWCPVAIDVTEELAAIRATEGETYAHN